MTVDIARAHPSVDSINGWYVVLGSVLAQLFVTGFYSYSFSLLVLPVQNDLEATRSQVMYSISASTLIAFMIVPFIGVMVDRYSPRRIMVAGTVLYAVGLWLLSKSGSILMFIIVFGVAMSLANNLLGAVTINPTVSRWFMRQRGRALGMAAMGNSLGGLIIPITFVLLIDQYGWRSALQIYACAVLVVLFPLMLLTIRPAPATDRTASLSARGNAPALTFALILRNPRFWLIGLWISLLLASFSAIMANVAPYAVSVGLDQSVAGRLILLAALGGVIGKLVFGTLADKISTTLLMMATAALMCCSFLMLLLMPTYRPLLLAAFLLGMSSGGAVPLWGVMLATTFGLERYGRVMGSMAPLVSIIVTAGFAISGISFDRTGDYTFLLGLLLAACVVSVLLALALKVAHTRNPAPL